MAELFKMLCYTVAAALIFALGGCAPSSANKPDPNSPPTAGSTAPGGQRQPGEGQRDATRDSPLKDGSMKDLQEGRPPITPPSSPLKDVYFDFDRYDLKGDARDILRANAGWLKSNPAARTEIEGHCDDRGTNEYNLALGAKRAQAAKDYLVTLGISAERLSTISYGSEVPVCKEQNESCWRQNRRARFVMRMRFDCRRMRAIG